MVLMRGPKFNAVQLTEMAIQVLNASPQLKQRALALRRKSTPEAGAEMMAMLHENPQIKRAIVEADERDVQEFQMRIAHWLLYQDMKRN